MKEDDDITNKLLKDAAPKKNKGGRPSSFKPEFCEKATMSCLLGATNEELAEKVFKVGLRTLETWIATKPEFQRAILAGREEADNEVAKSLYRRAIGYTHPAVKIFMDKGKPVIVNYTEIYPPSEIAMFWWLKNRQRDKWKERTDIELAANEITVTIGGKKIEPKR